MIFDSFGLDGLSVRRLGGAVAASVAVHLLLFWPAGLRVLTRESPSPLQARLLAPAPALANLDSPQPRPRAALDAGTDTNRPRPPAPPTEPKPGTNTQLEPSRLPLVPHTTAAPVDAVAKPATGLPSGAAAETGVTARGPATGPAAVAEPTEPGVSREAAEGLRGYRIALATQARRFKRYPAQAMAAGWEGSVEVRLDVGASGVPWPATLARSSGHAALDQSALAMIDAGARRARLPESLRGKAFAVVLPVLFSLDEE